MQIDTARDAADMLAPLFEARTGEVLAVLHLDVGRRVLTVAEYDGELDSAAIPFRAIVEDSFRLGSRALVLAHNHPSGDSNPSEEDLAVTRKLAQVLAPLGMSLDDHLIFAGRDCCSLRGLGLL